MATSGESIRKLLIAHSQRDDQAFLDAATEYIDEEKRRNHKLFARDLERIIQSKASRTANVTSLNYLYSGSLPRDKEKGTALVEVVEPRKSLQELVLKQSIREQLERLLLEQTRSEELRNFGLEPISKLLFCGPPGCGKTVAAEAIAQALCMPLVIVRFDAVISSYLGETASNLRRVFDFATSHPVVLFLDEFDAVGKERASEDEHGELKRVVTSLLQMLDSYKGESVTIAASNHQALLDSAIWRRFGEVVYFEPPTAAESSELMKRLFSRVRLEKGISLPTMARMLSDASFADVERIAIDAMKTAVLEQKDQVSKANLVVAINRFKNRLRSSKATNAGDSKVGKGTVA